MPAEFRDVYRNRAEAHGFLEGLGLPVSRAKFYDDADRLRFVQPDKTVRLVDLLAYARAELKVDPVTGRSLAEVDRGREKEELELRKLRVEVEAAERKTRREDARWIERAEHEIQIAAFAGRLEDSLRQRATLALADLLFACGGDPERGPELRDGLEQMIAAAFADAVSADVEAIAFAPDPEVEADAA